MLPESTFSTSWNILKTINFLNFSRGYLIFLPLENVRQLTSFFTFQGGNMKCIPSKKSLIPDFKWPPYGFFCSSKQGQTLPSDVHGNIWPHSMQFWLRLMGPWFYLQLFFRQSVPYWTLCSNVKRNIKVPPISDYLSLIT